MPFTTLTCTRTHTHKHDHRTVARVWRHRLLALLLAWPVAALPVLADDWRSAAEKALSARNWSAAADHYASAADAQMESGDHYNHACVLALNGKSAAALLALGKAIDKGWANVAHLEKDSDLQSLRALPEWSTLLQRARDRQLIEQRQYGAKALETAYRPQLSVAERVAGLSRLWSEAKYNFANFDLVPDLDWDALYLDYLMRVQKEQSTADYYRELTRFIARLRDGHTNVYAPDELDDQLYARPPMRTRLIENRVLITQILHDSLREQGLQTGMEILRVNDQPVIDYARTQIAPLVSASTPQDMDARLFNYQLLMGDAAQPLRLQVQAEDGQIRELQLRRWTPAERQNLPAQQAPFAWRMLPGNIALVELNGFGDDTAANEYLKHFPEISRATSIIFDVRLNGGGNSNVGYRVLATLTDQGFATSQWQTRKYVAAWRAWQRGQQAEGGTGSWAADGERLYRGPVAVLISGETYSAAEDFVGAFKQMQRGIIVGSATGGSTGQPLFIALPGGGSARICAKRDRLADGSEFVGKGLPADVPAAATVAGFRAGRDEVLETALAKLATLRPSLSAGR